MIDPRDLAREFVALVGRPARLFRAPGRVNLIGEHTDYNDGFVMPMALDRSTWVAAAPRADRLLVVQSGDYGESATIDLDALSVRTEAVTVHWSDYVRGVATILQRHGRLGGADMMIVSDVPIGAGLSSSAALSVACGYTLMELADVPVDLNGLARAAQRAEHEFARTRCGIMDQMIACHARAETAICLDTRSLDFRWLPLPGRVCVVVCNTMVRHELAAGEYNARRRDCEEGVTVFARREPRVRALRDVTLTDLDAAKDRLPDRIYRRCRHVITENLRVTETASALEAGDFPRMGALMNASHDSLRVDYDVSCPELDAMAAVARSLAGVYGARMTGGGFGGSVVALVDAIAVAGVVRDIARGYEAATGLTPDVWATAAGAGVGSVSMSLPEAMVEDSR